MENAHRLCISYRWSYGISSSSVLGKLILLISLYDFVSIIRCLAGVIFKYTLLDLCEAVTNEVNSVGQDSCLSVS